MTSLKLHRSAKKQMDSDHILCTVYVSLKCSTVKCYGFSDGALEPFHSQRKYANVAMVETHGETQADPLTFMLSHVVALHQESFHYILECHCVRFGVSCVDYESALTQHPLP